MKYEKLLINFRFKIYFKIVYQINFWLNLLKLLMQSDSLG